MSETAPAFTPSPGIPNAAHALFYAELAKQGGPSAPASSGQQFQTPASAARIAQKAAEYEKTATEGQPAAAVSSRPTVDSIKEYQANRGKPAQSVVLDGAPDQIARIDADMRAKGQQTGADTVGAKEALIALKRSTPMGQQTTAWKADWERKFAAADAAGETPAAEAKPAEAKPAAIAPTAETNSPSREVNAAIDFVMKNSNADGMMVSHSIPKELLSGYTLPGGARVHAETAIRRLADARRDGVPQSVVDAYVRALK